MSALILRLEIDTLLRLALLLVFCCDRSSLSLSFGPWPLSIRMDQPKPRIMHRLFATGLAYAMFLLLPATTATWNGTEVRAPLVPADTKGNINSTFIHHIYRRQAVRVVNLAGKHTEEYYDQYHDIDHHHSGIEGCPAPFRVVPNLMGTAAINCAECLSTLQGRHSCKDECGALQRVRAMGSIYEGLGLEGPGRLESRFLGVIL